MIDFCIRSVVTWIIATAATISSALGQSPQQSQRLEFFEQRIRPVLIESCYSCHSTHGKQKGDVALDDRRGIRSEASAGIIVVPGKPEQSILLKVLRHELAGLEMPADNARVSDSVIADFKKWIEDGAVDPRDKPPSKEDLEVATAWPAKLALRRQWWSLKPITAIAPPPDEDWSPHAIDRFAAKAQRQRNLKRAVPADKRTLLRRLSYALTGLPPTTNELQRFAQDIRTDAHERAVDRLLASPRFGEHWARHWMDVVRYADSHGSEGDPSIPYAHQYRDYLIRAFNQDVPYDQLVREHIAGDLLTDPRINARLGINESTLGTAHWRFVFHGYLPTEPLQEKVRFIDDQINVLGKAFLGQTISCARCHDHKFDAISQADYYALYGVFASCRPGIHDANTKAFQAKNSTNLLNLKESLRELVGVEWQRYAGTELPRQLAIRRQADDPKPANDHPAKWLQTIDQRVAAGENFQEAVRDVLLANEIPRELPSKGIESLGPTVQSPWFMHGFGLAAGQSMAGSFVVDISGDKVVRRIYPSGAYTHLTSSRHRGIIQSPRFKIREDQTAWALVTGQQAQLRCVIQDYPRSGLTYSRNNLNHDQWKWQRIDLSYWRGDEAHVELTTSRDAPIEVGNDDRSFFGIREVRLQPKSAPAPTIPVDPFAILPAIRNDLPPDRPTIVKLLVRRISAAIEHWNLKNCSDEDALLLAACLQHKLLPNKPSQVPGAAQLLATYRALESDIPLPTRIPGLLEANATDHPLFERGDPKKPGASVPRGFLTALGGTRYEGQPSGRRSLADDLTRPDNPLTARVMVNRIWHHLFGLGLVATPDNFGKLGAMPSHPELLDHLAARFMANGWSIKDTMRYIVTSKTWCLASNAPDTSATNDPNSKWLTHARIRRLSAEALRDSLFASAGTLDNKMFGKTFRANAMTPRRSVYMRSRRNDMDTFLTAFDAPTPFAPVGARLVTNVPAQSLAMLNSPLVWNLAERWATQTAEISDESMRIRRMFETATARPPTKKESDAILSYIKATTKTQSDQQAARQVTLTELANARANRSAILQPLRQSLTEQGDARRNQNGPDPIAAWDFQQSSKDLIGDLEGKLHGSARIDEDGLLLDGDGWFSTSTIQRDLTAKTLEAWVQLDGMQQRGGGVVSLQDLSGTVFDSIVYGERQPARWISGSDNFQRTQDVGGKTEVASTTDAPVHLAITYAANGTISIYREGIAYGRPYQSQLAQYRAGETQLLVGLRHGKSAGGRTLRGHVIAARLYDRALTPAEISASSNGTAFVSDREVIAALSDGNRNQLMELENAIAVTQQKLAKQDDATIDRSPWVLAAHAIFNLKEFQYLR